MANGAAATRSNRWNEGSVPAPADPIPPPGSWAVLGQLVRERFHRSLPLDIVAVPVLAMGPLQPAGALFATS